MNDIAKHFDTGLKIATTVALISVALLGTKFVTKEEFTAANARIEKIEAVLIRMEATVRDADHALANLQFPSTPAEAPLLDALWGQLGTFLP